MPLTLKKTFYTNFCVRHLSILNNMSETVFALSMNFFVLVWGPDHPSHKTVRTVQICGLVWDLWIVQKLLIFLMRTVRLFTQFWSGRYLTNKISNFLHPIVNLQMLHLILDQVIMSLPLDWTSGRSKGNRGCLSWPLSLSRSFTILSCSAMDKS